MTDEVTETKTPAPKKKKAAAKPEKVMYEIYHGNIYLPDPDPDPENEGDLKHYAITHDKDNVPSEPIKIDATDFGDDICAILDARKGIRKL